VDGGWSIRRSRFTMLCTEASSHVSEWVRWDGLRPGQSLQPSVWRLTGEEVASYVQAVEDAAIATAGAERSDPAVPAHLAPPMLAAVYCLRSFVAQDMELPPGGIHLRQLFRFLAPIQAGDTLTTVATVEQCRPRGDKTWVALSTRTTNQSGTLVSTSRFTGVWPRESL